MKSLQKILCLAACLFTFLAHKPASAQVTHLTITQVYGGGGGTSTSTVPTYNQDYVEIFNPTTGAISLNGLSVQYSPATFTTPTSGNNVALGNVNLQPGQYYLVGGATSGSYTGLPLSPAANVQGATLAIASTNGSVFLVSNTTAITTCTAATIIDKVGFGSATCSETTASPVLTSESALLRSNGNGICADTNVNSADFGAPVTSPNGGATPTFAPHNLSSTLTPCSAAAASLTAGGFPSTIAKGTAGTITVTAKNSSGVVATGYLGTVKLTSSDSAATLPAAYTFTAADMGVHTFSVTFNTAGTQSITATDSGYGIAGTQTGITVTNAAPAASITASGYPTPTNQGAAHTITVTAKDSTGNTATTFTDTVAITSSDPAAVLPAPYTFTAADAGTHAFTVILNTAGTQTITATDTNNGTFTSTQTGIVVNASLWIVNRDTTVSHLSQGGLVLSTAGTSGSTATLGAIAIDNAAYAYAVTNIASNVTQYNPTTGALLFTSTAGGINLPTSIAVDGLGNLWIANTNNSISELTPSTTAAPTAVSPATGYQGGLSGPSNIVIDATGSVWVTNSTGASFTRFFGAAAPVVTPLVKAIDAGTQGTRP